MKYFLKIKELPEGSCRIEDAKSSEEDISSDTWLEVHSSSYDAYMAMANNPNSLINTRKAFAEIYPKSFLGNIGVALDPNQELRGPDLKPNEDNLYEITETNNP